MPRERTCLFPLRTMSVHKQFLFGSQRTNDAATPFLYIGAVAFAATASVVYAYSLLQG